MSTQSDLYDTTGPDAPALSRDERQLVDDVVGIIDDLPTLEFDDVLERFEDDHGRFLFNGDDNNPSASTPKLDDYRQQYEPAHLKISSFGEKREDCGVGIPHVCEGCGHTVEIGRTCAQSMCPRCWAAWCMERAVGIVARIMSAAKMKDGAQYKHHGVISPPEELYVDAEHPEQAFMDAVGDMMDKFDMDGIALYHPWSGDDSDPVDEELEAGDDDRGAWKHRIGEDRSWHGDVREELKHRPHAHVIGATEHFPGGDTTAEIYRETGWVIHRITERNGSPISLKNEHNVARAVLYSLSHTGIDTRTGEDSGQGGDHNAYVHTKRGSVYHKPTDDLEEAHPSHAENLRDAKEAIHNVAPDVLGVSTGSIECQTQVERLEDAEKDHDVSEHLDDADGAGDGDGADDLEDDGGASTSVVKCRGDMVDVDEAEFVEDEDWQRKAEHAEEAVEAREAWKEAGGWQGWTGQATLDGERLEETDPPPG